MIILNFSHPLTEIQIRETEALVNKPVDQVYEIHTQFDNDRPYEEQLNELTARIPIDARQLQTEPILVVLPSLNFISAELLAWLHGVMGYFPAVLRIKPDMNEIPPTYHAAEILNLQSIRNQARTQR